MIETRSGATALNKHKGLQQFFKWLMEDAEDIDRSPMDRVKQPKPQKKLIAVIRDDDTKKVLSTCKGKDFVQLRDEAIIRLYYNTGARLSEVGNLRLDDLNQDTDSVYYHGKGNKDRRVRYGPKTARAISRYLRARAKHKGAELPDLWLADRGIRPLKPNGIKIMIKGSVQNEFAQPRPVVTVPVTPCRCADPCGVGHPGQPRRRQWFLNLSRGHFPP